MRDYELTTLYVDYTHLLTRDEVLARAIQTKYYRFLPYLRRAVHNLVEAHTPEYLQASPNASRADAITKQTKEFSVAFYHLPLVSGIRDLKTDKIGTLLSVSGTVTRTSEVRPELLFGAFVCEVCGGMVPDVEQQFKYTEPALCANPTCGNRDVARAGLGAGAVVRVADLYIADEYNCLTCTTRDRKRRRDTACAKREIET